jgi:hypothetical protein
VALVVAVASDQSAQAEIKMAAAAATATAVTTAVDQPCFMSPLPGFRALAFSAQNARCVRFTPNVKGQVLSGKGT